jgi:iron complex transport system permease protein
MARPNLILVLLLAVAMIASLHLGLRLYHPVTVLAGLRGGTDPDALIVAGLRVPRTLVGVVAGGALGLSGLLMQAATRNPLAEPGLLGVNAGAAFAVTLGITGFGSASLIEIGGLAFLGALLATGAVFGITLAAGRSAGPATTLLAGVTVAGMLASLTQLMLLLDETALETLLFWLSGGFADRDTGLLKLGLPTLTGGLIGALLLAPALDALRLDDDSARAVGVSVGRARLCALALAAALAAGAVAMAGPVVFLGLVAPHIARGLVLDAGMAALAVATVLIGAITAVVADIVARLVVAPGEAPVGAVLAVVGVPLLVALLRQRREAVL